MTDKIRWGIMAPGNISRKMATGLTHLADAEIAAVGARSQESADRFGDEFNVPRRHVGYENLAADPEVDAIYIASPHPFHKEHSILSLTHGKAVLCEKPFTINATEAKEVIDTAHEQNIFLMEAMWTRFIPLVVEVRRLVAEGEIGDLRMITSDFGFRTNVNPAGRLFDPALGGGGLLDVGIYPLSFVSMLLGKPERIVSMAELGETGVDEQAGAILGYPNGQLALIHTAIRTTTPHETTIMGTEGRIRIQSPSWIPTKMTIHRNGQEPENVVIPFEGNGYNYQAAEVHRCLREGKVESEIMPLDETLAVMEMMDEIRGQWGLTYPMEV